MIKRLRWLNLIIEHLVHNRGMIAQGVRELDPVRQLPMCDSVYLRSSRVTLEGHRAERDAILAELQKLADAAGHHKKDS